MEHTGLCHKRNGVVFEARINELITVVGHVGLIE